MKTKTRYAERLMGEVRIAKDFLPSADQLVLKEEKVTIAVSRRNLGHICQRAGKVQQAEERSKTPSELLTNPETSVNALSVDDHSSGNQINLSLLARKVLYESSHVTDVDVFFEKLFSGNKLNDSGTVPGKRECDL